MRRWAGVVLAVVVVTVGAGLAVAGDDGAARRPSGGTGPGSVAGVLKITGLECPLPPGWAQNCSVSFYRYFRDTAQRVPCSGSMGDGGGTCTLPQWSSPPTLTVSVDHLSRFHASLKPGKYYVAGYPCGQASVDVRSGVILEVSLGCVWGAVGHVSGHTG